MTAEDVYEPTVSVIVPVVNAEATIKDLLDSLIEVDYDKGKLDVIVVDGGSTDRTRDIVQMYRVKLVLESRRGINVARNAGVRNSQGEIVAFTDADCAVPKDWIKRIVENFKDPNVGCLGGSVSRYKDDFISIYADNSIVPVLRRFKKHEILDNVEPLSRYPAGCNMAVRRSAIEKLNGFDEQIRHGFDEDELVERICNSGFKMVLDPSVMIKHKHRQMLSELLRQTFNYGRGGYLLFKRKPRGRFSMWILLSLVSFIIWLVVSFSFLFLTITFNTVFVAPLLSITLIPYLILALFYLYEGSGRKRDIAFVAYPFMDLLRFLAFYSGGIYELLNMTDETD